MSEGYVVREVHSLEELNNLIAFTGEAMANIEENVSRYLDGVKDVLEKQLDVIRKRLDEAKERLDRAQAALSRCEARQRYDSESGEYRPSCSWQERAVEAAQREVDKWQRKYDEGKRIVDECQHEIDEYNEPASFLYPPGGHFLIRNMCENQTPNITRQLREHIEEVYDYKQQDVGGEEGASDEITNPNVQKEDKPMSEDEKLSEFEKNMLGIKKEQADESAYYGVQDANRAMRCPDCGMPLQLCTCKNLHADVNLYE